MVDSQDHPASNISSRDNVRRRAKTDYVPPSAVTVDEALSESLDDVLRFRDGTDEKEEH